MTTLCLSCGEKFDSRIPFAEGIQSMRHLRSEHPDLWKQFKLLGSSSVMTATQLDSGEVVHFVGDIIQYEGEDGQQIIKVTG